MKTLLKNILVKILGWQVRRLRKKNDFKIVGVAGSIGKTSTKLAIAKVLEAEKKVRYQEGNYNEIVSVPLVFFGYSMPPLWNFISWLKIIFQNEAQIWKKFPFDVVVVELGTDAPGQIGAFRKYLHLDIAVLTAVAPEHMEFFRDLEKVAEEEWSVSFFSDKILANRDLCKIVPMNVDHRKIVFYGKDLGSVYKIDDVEKAEEGFYFDILREGEKITSAFFPAVSEVQLYSICAAAAVADSLGLKGEKIKEAISGIRSFSGRMQRLRGIRNSTIIDDTYNASPDAVKMALNTLYAFEAPQRIAILGMMNELGATSEEEHKKIGSYCNPHLLDLVVTVGQDANLYLAPVARERGCEVYEFQSSLEAGKLVSEKLKEGAVILAKGSQNGVFAEEALKPLLADQADFAKLVRQEPEWMKKKAKLSTEKLTF
jgi:UDP-N-acetylmuramoyl-tripeptide--D-alanyl-D-alanine ligase